MCHSLAGLQPVLLPRPTRAVCLSAASPRRPFLLLRLTGLEPVYLRRRAALAIELQPQLLIPAAGGLIYPVPPTALEDKIPALASCWEAPDFNEAPHRAQRRGVNLLGIYLLWGRLITFCNRDLAVPDPHHSFPGKCSHTKM